jgi:hypothetical protein
MKATQFRTLIREEVQLAVFEQQLSEGKLSDFFGQIKAAATKAAKDSYQDAEKLIDMNKLASKPLPTNSISKAQSELETKSQALQEGFIDTIRNFSRKALHTGLMGSAVSAITALSAGMTYLDASFTKWYYEYIQGMAESEVMRVMTDLYGAKAAEGSIWFKLGAYAFLVFFVVTLLSIATLKLTRQKNKL